MTRLSALMSMEHVADWGLAWPFLLLVALWTALVVLARGGSLCLALVRARRDVRRLDDLVEIGSDDALRGFIAGRRSPVARVVDAAVRHPDADDAQVASALDTETRRWARRHGRGLAWLGTVVTVAPLVGFLGTIEGIVSLFGTCAYGSEFYWFYGIGDALYTSIAGLGLAIPAQIALTLFTSWAEELDGEMEDVANRILVRRARNGS